MGIIVEALVFRNLNGELAPGSVKAIPGSAANVMRLFITRDAINPCSLNMLNFHHALHSLASLGHTDTRVRVHANR